MRSGGQWIGILAFALAACESSAFERVVNCPACGQGEIRYAARVETLDHIWITARDDGGLAVLADNQVRILDHKLVQLSSQEVLGYGSLGGDGESIYVAQRIERDDAPITRLSKIGRDGEIVWRQVLDLESINGVDANSQIVYVSASTVTPPYSPVLEVFSAIEGSPLRRAGSGQSFRAVTDGDVSVSNDAIRASVITKRTVAGTEQWSRSVVAAEGGEVGLFVSGIAVDASVTLIGGFTGCRRAPSQPVLSSTSTRMECSDPLWRSRTQPLRLRMQPRER